MTEYAAEALSAEQVLRMRATFEPLTQAVRDLIDAVIRSEADDNQAAAARAEIESATARLRSRQLDGHFGARRVVGGEPVAWGNAATGLRNPLAPPVVVKRERPGTVSADLCLGAAYEGPPGHVHGGYCALILDHLLGEVASGPDNPRFTGTLRLRYMRATPLGIVHAEARIERIDGVKTYAVGQLSDADGATIEVEGIFIQPKWARG